tara:strand:- start:711 stop:1550 length:840 start_codon:yes stop_codon:yes gene_type:complete
MKHLEESMPNLELKDHVAIITGAGRMRGIGRASANVLAKMGANIVVTGTGRNPKTYPEDEQIAGWKDIESTAKEIQNSGHSALPIVVDVTNPDSVNNMINKTMEAFGRIDILVNNAAAPYGPDRVPVLELDDKVFQKTLIVKVFGTYLCAKAAATQMVKQGNGGRIINLSSSAGKRGDANMAAYNAANFAVDGFTQAMSKELAKENITVNAVCPGLTETARMDPMGRGEKWLNRVAEIPMGRVAKDEEIADLIGFLSSPRASYITGQAININGGYLTAR